MNPNVQASLKRRPWGRNFSKTDGLAFESLEGYGGCAQNIAHALLRRRKSENLAKNSPKIGNLAKSNDIAISEMIFRSVINFSESDR